MAKQDKVTDSKKKLLDANFDAVKSHAKPSQIPFNCVLKSYERMLRHCMIQGVGNVPVWACSKNGARVNAYVRHRNIWNRDGSLSAAMMPVAFLYCSGCDKKPQIKSGDPLWVEEVTTLSM